jgi:PKHD-type hydroxylase
MQYILTPYGKSVPTLSWWDNAFSSDELDYLQNLALSASADAYISQGDINKNIRRSKLYWLESFESKESLKVYQKLSHIISSLNVSFYNYDLTGFGEAIQLTNYDSADNGTYDWHCDSRGDNICRKLSLSLQLSEPTSYDGGDLEVMDQNKITQIQKKRGYIAVFPSFTYHRVTPVTRGSRQSLVVWISGPPFR